MMMMVHLLLPTDERCIDRKASGPSGQPAAGGEEERGDIQRPAHREHLTASFGWRNPAAAV
jgi:hypothetical protein